MGGCRSLAMPAARISRQLIRPQPISAPSYPRPSTSDDPRPTKIECPARTIHEALTAAVDPGLLTGFLGPRPLRRRVQLHLGFSALRVPVMRPIGAASLRPFMNNAGWRWLSRLQSGRARLPVAPGGISAYIGPVECGRGTVRRVIPSRGFYFGGRSCQICQPVTAGASS